MSFGHIDGKRESFRQIGSLLTQFEMELSNCCEIKSEINVIFMTGYLCLVTFMII